MYPEYDKWREIVKSIDPYNLYQSELKKIGYQKLVNNFILVGASSEFANSYIKKCKEHKYNIYCISRSFISEVSKVINYLLLII